MKENVFVIGAQVSGDFFIGRKKLIEEYRKKFIISDVRYCVSMVGLTRIGKTSFVKKVFENIDNPKILYVYKDVAESQTYFQVWYGIFKELKKRLRRIKIELDQDILAESQELLDDLLEYLDDKNTDNISWSRFLGDVKDIFSCVTELGLKVILVLDEFDHARIIFNNDTSKYELLRTLLSDPEFNVSSIIVSRRKLETIEGKTYQSSTLRGVLDFNEFKGFDNDDMNEFYQKFTDYGITLTNVDKEIIDYYCGRMPLILANMGYEIVNMFNNNEYIDIYKAYNKICVNINSYYESCIKRMKDDGDFEKVVAFVIGPKQIVTDVDKSELLSIGYIEYSPKLDKFISLSEHFSEYFLTNEVLSSNIWENLISVEKSLKNIIRLSLINILEDCASPSSIVKLKSNWYSFKELQRDILLNCLKNDKGMDTLDRFITSNKKIYNKDTFYFDVMSLDFTVKIIRRFWYTVKKYFDNRGYDDFKEKFNKCISARNPYAHGHEEFLSDEDKSLVDKYCKEILTILEKTLSKEDVPDNNKLIRDLEYNRYLLSYK